MQFLTFNYVFSPRAASGYAARLFDLQTGAIDPSIAHYWEAHYDISAILSREWLTDSADLRGKFNFIVGTSDTFYLDRSVRLMQSALAPLGFDGTFTYLNGMNHWQILDWDGGFASHIVENLKE